MLATNRTDKVTGRTIILIVSINTKKGFNQSGAPPGNNPAIKVEGELKKLDIIKDNHKGSPNIKLNTICLEYANLYGNNPIKLIIINITNNLTTKVLNPLI